MGTIKVGYRRLYDAMGCSISEQKEWTASFSIAKYFAEVYIGSRPKYGVAYNKIHTPKYQVPGEETPMVTFEFQKDASKSTYPRNFFTEIAVFEEVDVPNELYRGFIQGDSASQQSILEITAENNRKQSKIADVIAGTIGLRFHCQFVMEIVCENPLAIRNSDDWAFQMVGPAMQLLEAPALNQTGIGMLDQLLPSIGQSSEKAISFGSKALEWLLRAWVEHDPVSKFTFLFIAVEVVLGKVSKIEEPFNESVSRIKALIEACDSESKDQDISYFEMAVRAHERQPMSLSERFELLAQDAKMAGWENDVIAFRKFNRIRNHLVHQGDSNLDLQVPVSEDEVRQLEDLTERYVSLALFGDGRVYTSRYRPTSNQQK
jgi:hypothetical protein